MQELEDIKANVNVDATVLVVDAMTGQDAVNVAQNFSDKVGIDGVILTKMDGDTRGGAALSIKAVTGKPILGMGDVMSLIEKVEASVDQEQAQEMQKKLKKMDFDFNDYLTSMEQMNKMGGISSILNMLPGMGGKMKDIEGMIDPEKDLDGISPVNIAKVFAGDDSGFAPCTAEAVVEVLKAAEIPMTGKRVTIVGRSMVVGKPLSMLMVKENATVTICHTRTKDLAGTCRNAEILVAAAGRAKMLNGDYVGQDAVVIDVGINVDENGKLCGDVDYDTIQDKAQAATPVPGGVGAVTTAVLAKHLVRAAGL